MDDYKFQPDYRSRDGNPNAAETPGGSWWNADDLREARAAEREARDKAAGITTEAVGRLAARLAEERDQEYPHVLSLGDYKDAREYLRIALIPDYEEDL